MDQTDRQAGMVGTGGRSPRRSKGWVVGAGVLATFLVVLGLVAAGLTVRNLLREVVSGRGVGPDADEMARDPLLQLHIEGADPGDIVTRTGKEGGLMPAMQNDESSAYRVWYVDRDEGQEQLAQAVEGAARLGVRIWSLRCSEGSPGRDFSYAGAKQVSVGEETVVASVSISLNIEPRGERRQRPELAVWLTSDGERETIEPSERTDGRMTGDCPDLLLDAFNAAR